MQATSSRAKLKDARMSYDAAQEQSVHNALAGALPQPHADHVNPGFIDGILGNTPEENMPPSPSRAQHRASSRGVVLLCRSSRASMKGSCLMRISGGQINRAKRCKVMPNIGWKVPNTDAAYPGGAVNSASLP